MKRVGPIVLCILDGFGLNKKSRGNAVWLAKTPTFDYLRNNFPSSTLTTFGTEVGLPKNQMGNSEVGHLHIGSGRVIESMLPKIDGEIESDKLRKNKILLDMLARVSSEGGEIHIAGMFSEGGVHGHIRHLKSLVSIASDRVKKVNLHLFSDGRDVETKTSINDLANLSSDMPQNAYIASLMGRYFSMDRDNRWERTQKAFEAIVNGIGKKFKDPSHAIRESYLKGVTDEFIEPVVFENYNGIQEKKDGLIFTNFRADRARQILHSIIKKNFSAFPRSSNKFFGGVVGMIDYDPALRDDIKALFLNEKVVNGLGQWVSSKGLRQFRIAETEKYPHVTYFFNGGNEAIYKGEERELVPSPRVKSYDLQPEMSAVEVCSKLTSAIKKNCYDLLIVNFANPDMVGHTGKLSATKVAVETVDKMLRKILNCLEPLNGEALIVSDHGNCEEMLIDNTSKPHTFHTLNPVPAILFSKREKISLSNGSLIDVAPTILDLMSIDKPTIMTGKSLIFHEN